MESFQCREWNNGRHSFCGPPCQIINCWMRGSCGEIGSRLSTGLVARPFIPGEGGQGRTNLITWMQHSVAPGMRSFHPLDPDWVRASTLCIYNFGGAGKWEEGGTLEDSSWKQLSWELQLSGGKETLIMDGSALIADILDGLLTLYRGLPSPW